MIHPFVHLAIIHAMQETAIAALLNQQYREQIEALEQYRAELQAALQAEREREQLEHQWRQPCSQEGHE